jgi:heat shock protein HtpX
MNYRAVKKSNIKKTNIVMAIYIVLFFLIGLLGETIWRASSIPNDVNLPTAMSMVFKDIIHFNTFPIFTLIMTSIAIVIILFTIKMGNKIMMAGNENILLNDKENLSLDERMVLNIVEELKISSRLRFMPEVYIIEENYMNAFASGWTEENSMVAITRGLLNKLNRAEVEAVLAHEMAHVKNADIRLTLVVGVLTNVMLLAVDMLFYSVIGKSNSDNKTMQQAKLVIFVLRFLLPLLTIVLQLYISRKREFMADAGSVEFTGNRDSMISALQKISGDYEENQYSMEGENNTRRYAAIFSPKSLFSTHPSIEDRINSLNGTLKP